MLSQNNTGFTYSLLFIMYMAILSAKNKTKQTKVNQIKYIKKTNLALCFCMQSMNLIYAFTKRFPTKRISNIPGTSYYILSK